MRGFNRVVLAGNLTRDPELRYTVNKKAFARLGLAVNNRFRNASGEYQETTDYINLVAWGSTAETANKYLKKGSPVLIEGKLKSSSYEAKDGSGKRTSIEVWIDSLVLLGSGQGSSGGSALSSFGGGMPSMQVPDDSDFGKSIGESGFGGGDFGNSSSIPDGLPENEIPF